MVKVKGIKGEIKSKERMLLVLSEKIESINQAIGDKYVILFEDDEPFTRLKLLDTEYGIPLYVRTMEGASLKELAWLYEKGIRDMLSMIKQYESGKVVKEPYIFNKLRGKAWASHNVYEKSHLMGKEGIRTGVMV